MPVNATDIVCKSLLRKRDVLFLIAPRSIEHDYDHVIIPRLQHAANKVSQSDDATNLVRHRRHQLCQARPY